MSICDKNNPPERSDEELNLSRQERARIESIIRSENLDSPGGPEVPADVRRDINEFNRLSNIENSINKVSGGEAVKGKKLPAIERQLRFDGVVANVDEIIKVAQMQNAILATTLGPSYNLSFRSPRTKSDCSKNINDLIIEAIKKIIMKLIRESGDDPDPLMALLDSLSALSSQISNIFELIEKAQSGSLADLLILAKNSGLLDRVGIIQDITKKFGGKVGNLNSILANIQNFDVCNMPDFSSFGNLLTQPSNVNPEPAPPHPDPGPLITIDSRSQALTAEFIDHKDAAGDLINGSYSSTDLKDDPSYGSLLTSLNTLYYGFKNEVSVNGTSGFQAKADKEIERTLDSKRDEWSGNILNEFKARAESVRDLVMEDASILQQDYARRNFT